MLMPFERLEPFLKSFARGAKHRIRFPPDSGARWAVTARTIWQLSVMRPLGRAPAQLKQGSGAMKTRHRFKQTRSLKERLLEEAQNLRDEAKLLSSGPVRDAVLKKARETEAAAHMDDWLNSPGLRSPKTDDPPGPG